MTPDVLAHAVRDARRSMNLSVRELARRCRTGQLQVAMLENGNGLRLRYQTVKTILFELGLSLAVRKLTP